MAKSKGTLGKFLAFTTTVIAISGTCYVFRDKIRQSSIYKSISSKLSDLFENFSKDDNFFEDDFFLDNEADNEVNSFSESPVTEREYTSLTSNSKESDTTDTAGSNLNEEKQVISDSSFNKNDEQNTSTTEIAGYENAGLSDVSEDPDTLEEQDQLDF